MFMVTCFKNDTSSTFRISKFIVITDDFSIFHSIIILNGISSRDTLFIYLFRQQQIYKDYIKYPMYRPIIYHEVILQYMSE